MPELDAELTVRGGGIPREGIPRKDFRDRRHGVLTPGKLPLTSRANRPPVGEIKENR